LAANPMSTTRPSPGPAVPSSPSVPPGPVDLVVPTLDSTMMDHDMFDTGCDTFDTGTHDANPDAVSGPAVIDLRKAAPANVISSAVTSPTTANPGVVDPSTTIPSVITPAATTPSVAIPTVTNLHVVNPANIDSPTVTGSTVDNPTMAAFGVTSPATADPDASPTIVIHSALASTAAYHGVTIPTTSAPEQAGPPSLTVTSATPVSFDYDSSSQGTSHLAKSAPGMVYPKFVTSEVITHLSSITNIDGWSDLIQIYLKFEATSPPRSVSLICFLCCVQPLICILQVTRLPAKGRPLEVGAWLKDPTNLHVSIADTTAYVKAWIGWWTACQLTGRATVSWPFVCEPLDSTQWVRLLNGGRNGIFLFVMALSWWAASPDWAASSPSLTEAVADVKWVLRQLVDTLTAPPAPALTTGVALTGGKGQYTKLVHCKYTARKWTMYLGYTHLVHPKYIQNFPCQFSCNFPGLENSQDIHSVPGHMTVVFPLCN